MDGEIKINNLSRLLMKDKDEKLWIAVLKRKRNKRGELFVKFRVYK